MNEVMNLLSEEKIKEIKDTLSSNKMIAPKLLYKNGDFNLYDLSKSISVDDVIIFKEKGLLKKAVVTAKGKRGVTARDYKQSLIKINYKDIENFEYREKR